MPQSHEATAAEKPQLDPGRILQTGLAFWGAKALLSAIELGLFNELAKGPADEAAIRARLGLHPRSSRDFLDALVSMGMLQRNGTLYSNTGETDLFLDRAKPTYVGGILEMCNRRLFKYWGSLTEALQTGKPQNEAKTGEKGLFESLYSDPAALREFLKAMTGLSMGAAMAIAQKFPWQKYKTFADVGAAQGCVPVQVALANPHLTGIGWDLPVVQPIFEDYIRSFGLEERLRFEAGDFFADALPHADVIIMGHILHDWDLEQKRQLIRKAYDALPAGGAFLVFEALIDDERRTQTFGLLMSINMLIETPGGFDYTGADSCAWMREAGFRETRVEHLVGPDSMVIGIK